jgi:hypothetical protein
MQKFRISGAIAVCAATLGGSAWAQVPGDFRAAARLADPAKAPAEAMIAGVSWRCTAQGCVGLAARYNTLDSVQRECRKVVAVLGPVTAYASRGQRLGRSSLSACNRAARPAHLAVAQSR